jgi:hypothetical protein
MRFLLPCLSALLLVGCATSEVGTSAADVTAPAESSFTLPRPSEGVQPVPATDRPIQLDGRLDPNEWLGLDPASCMKLTRTHDLEPAKQPSQVWLMRDRLWLYVGIRNQLDDSQPFRKNSVWGQNDGVELAFRDARDSSAPTFILRGFPSMRFQTPSLGGVKPKQVEKLSDGVSIRAKLQSRHKYWTMEWRIPLRAIGVDPRSARRVAFNITVCKPGSKEMVCWRPSTAETWRLDGKGILELAPQPPPRRIMVPGLTPTAN